jgi:hypothetical protein
MIVKVTFHLAWAFVDTVVGAVYQSSLFDNRIVHRYYLLDVQTSYYCRCRLQPERMYQYFAQAKYHFFFPIQQLRVLSSRTLRMLQPGYFRIKLRSSSC